MVHCSKCGTENVDDARFCVKCGASLYGAREKRGDTCFGGERQSDECFGVRHGSALIGIIVGIFIIVIGLIYFLNPAYLSRIREIVPSFIIILIGLFIVIGAITGLRRRRSQ